MIWDQELYLKAWNFASRVHNGQCIPGCSIAYINHIGLVTMEAMTAVASDSTIKNPDLLVQCALLHDVIEDTSTSYDEIVDEFGERVAKGVLALSKNSQLPTKAAQMKDSLKRIAQQPVEISMVKLCDRITNLQPPPEHWGQKKINAYHKEALLILEQLGGASDFLAKRLAAKITAYEYFL